MAKPEDHRTDQEQSEVDKVHDKFGDMLEDVMEHDEPSRIAIARSLLQTLQKRYTGPMMQPILRLSFYDPMVAGQRVPAWLVTQTGRDRVREVDRIKDDIVAVVQATAQVMSVEENSIGRPTRAQLGSNTRSDGAPAAGEAGIAQVQAMGNQAADVEHPSHGESQSLQQMVPQSQDTDEREQAANLAQLYGVQSLATYGEQRRQEVGSLEDRLVDEIGKYRRDPVRINEPSPTKYWNSNQRTFPILSKLASQYYPVMASSVRAE